MKLLGVGKNRFRTLSSAARGGKEFCPYDRRYVIREKKTPSESWERVHSFLTQMYMETAEHIPDGLNSNKRPRHGAKKLDSKDLDRSQIKHLPYGTINDYWNQCVAANPGIKISRKLFCSETLPAIQLDIFHFLVVPEWCPTFYAHNSWSTSLE